MLSCYICKKEKLNIEFYPTKDTRGRSNSCVACDKVRKAAWYQKNKKEIDARRRPREKAYRQANKEVLNEKQKARYASDKERFKRRSQAYRLANKEKIRESKRAYYQANREEISRKARAYYQRTKQND